MKNPEDEDMLAEFTKNLDKAQLARQIQQYMQGAGEGFFKEKRTEKEYKKAIMEMLEERKRNGL